MKRRYPYLKNSTFLSLIDSLKIKEEFVRITTLSFDKEEPLVEIQGKVSSGSVNLNGSSSVRRTANLTVLADEFSNDLTDLRNTISINKKIYLEKGIVNTTNKYTDYDIIWYPLGVYIVSSAQFQHSSSGMSISLGLKDKMCLLNGDCGGVFPAGIQFDKVQQVNSDGSIEETQPTFFQIIQELVNEWGGEPLNRIIISGVPLRTKQVVKWAPDDENTSGGGQGSDGASVVFSYNKPAGYIYKDFVVPAGTELVASPGDNICKILDSIVKMLGNYEYFYDVEGNFVFQEIHNYLTTSQATEIIEGRAVYATDYYKHKAVYVFDNSNLISSYSNTPQIQNMKNDFIVWGTRKASAKSNAYSLRYHIAIDTKPDVGNTYEVFKYTGQNDDNETITYFGVPVQIESESELPKKYQTDVFYSINGVVYMWDEDKNSYAKSEYTTESITTSDWRTELYLSGAESESRGYSKNYYYAELKNEWTKLYDVENGCFYDDVVENPDEINYFLDFISPQSAVGKMSIPVLGRRTYAKTDSSVNCVLEPDVPDYVLLNGEDEDIQDQIDECNEDDNQPYILLNQDNYDSLSSGSAFTSAYTSIRQIIHQYTNLCEKISLQVLPIYYLEPNQRITVYDEVSGISGDYIINSISLPLGISEVSTISASRALEMI